jgi:hypothetical protein
MDSIDILEKVCIPLVATFSGAFLAFRYQHSIEIRRDKRAVVQNLMMYNNVGADELDWIKALNVIEIVFHNHERVRQLYHRFLNLTTPPNDQTFEYIDVYYEMLYLMARNSGYTQLTLSDIKNCYAPRALQAHYPTRYKPDPLSSDDVLKHTTSPDMDTGKYSGVDSL